MKLGDALKNMREIYDYSVGYVSAELNTTEDVINRIEDNQLKPTKQNLKDFADLYNSKYSVLELLNEDDEYLGPLKKRLKHMTIDYIETNVKKLREVEK